MLLFAEAHGGGGGEAKSAVRVERMMQPPGYRLSGYRLWEAAAGKRESGGMGGDREISTARGIW